ncbi:MAG: hypothetical protein PHG31_04880 [Candidatus Omnitrophica bacterium]|nr:hypothetical protein [Candidatus Omnitrophota bacterium]
MRNLRSSLFISLIGHLAVWGIFSFSFGEPLQKPIHTPVFFWGQLLQGRDMQSDFFAASLPAIQIKKQEGARLLFKKPSAVSTEPQAYYLKPSAGLIAPSSKLDFMPRATVGSYPYGKQDAMIMLHPILPEYFMLLFQDRQVVNIGLEFKIITSKKRNYTILKRKISSGNLQADLLTMRYISHYLFIQGERFHQDSWQTISIELSTLKNKND